LKRALLVSRQVMAESGILLPDAIITGTGLGCIESTELFLDKLTREGEEFLNPTHFMQSTHNTIGSLIAIDTQCKSYNNTYSHKGISFECALQDAFLQMRCIDSVCPVSTALVSAHDEMLPAYFTLLKKAGFLGKPNQTFAGETAVAMMLSVNKTEKTLCEIDAVEKIYADGKKFEDVKKLIELKKLDGVGNVDYIMVGVSGESETDKIYFENCTKLFPNIPLLKYKNIFGEGYTVPALGVYAAATCLQRGIIPEHLRITNYELRITNKKVNKILCYNHFEGKNHTFILLSK
jgi:hypothetical protein